MPNDDDPRADRLRLLAGKAARWLQRSVARGEHLAVRAELAALGPLSAPVLLELGAQLPERDRQKLGKLLSTEIVLHPHPRSKAWRVLEEISSLFDQSDAAQKG